MRNTKIQFTVGIAISVAILYYILRPVDKGELLRAFTRCNWWWGIPFVGVTFLSMWARAVRWHFLMKPVGEFTSRRLFSPMMIGFGINSLLPARLGEFARAYVLGSKEGIPFTSVFATVVVERIFDTLTLLLLLVAVLSRIHIAPGLELEYAGFRVTATQMDAGVASLAWIGGVMFAGSLLLLFDPARRLIQRAIERVPFAPLTIRTRISAMVGTFCEGLHSLRDPKAWIAIVLLSAAVWVLVGFSMQVMAWGFPSMSVTLAQGIAITVFTAIAILVPAAPGYWGLMQLGIMFALVVMGIEQDRARALAYAFVVHALQYFPIVAVGLFCLWRERVSIGEIAKMKGDAP
jgi:glycosyltransferase 2 family protein